MNVVIIFLDSFRWDHVGVYHQARAPFEGVAPCKTPHLDRFAQKCVIFENAYPEALPTMPVRLQLMTGQRTLPNRGWEPMKENDIPIQKILREQGYVCGLVADTYHFRAPGMNYHKGFNCYRWVRGQEYDPWVSSPPKRSVDDYVNENYPEVWRKRIEQFLANTDDFKREEDWFPAKVFDEASRWLEANRCHKNVLLWVDSFDPHEPWDPPRRWDTYTNPSYSGKRLIMPMGGEMTDWANPEEIQYIRALYAGEASFVDHCFGKFTSCLEEEGYLEDSFILLLADHGHPLGDHGKFLKGGDRMYSELLKAPFLVHLPGSQNGGMRTDALVYFHDVLPTILDLMGQASNTESMHGKSFLPVLQGETNEHRPAIITGYFKAEDRCIRDKRWSYIIRPQGQPDELYDLQNDGRETTNLIDQQYDQAKRLSSLFGEYFRKGPLRRVKGIQGEYEMASGSVA
ncbi:MAG: sulfatase [Planctomycetes bacterium DG_23]|nr:MAG: sulfatase [Planctomycetes bacterium DG_23]